MKEGNGWDVLGYGGRDGGLQSQHKPEMNHRVLITQKKKLRPATLAHTGEVAGHSDLKG